MKKFRYIIAGSREFDNYPMLSEICGSIAGLKQPAIIVSGTARGADQLGERFAEEFGHDIHRYPADWNKYGKSAGYKRNELMAQNADCLIAFWDGKSRGTKHMIDLAEKYNLQVMVIQYPEVTMSDVLSYLDEKSHSEAL